MYKLDHAPDLTQAQAIHRRRRLDEERKQRIFDPKVRIMGIDVQGLEEQIRVKNELKSIEAERNATADLVAIETNTLLQMLDAKVSASRRAVQQDLDTFRRDQQQPCMQRDFDLYDPEALKKDRPARESDADARNTVSGLQKFEGEDLEQADRIAAQKHQMQLWTWQKMCENADRQRLQDWHAQQQEEHVMATNAKVQYLNEMERQHRRDIARSDAEFNKKLALEKKLRENQDRRKETIKNLEEIDMWKNGDLLTERPAPPQPGPHRIRIDAFKGMSAEQIQDIYATREQQIRETRQKREQERQHDHQWEKHRFWTSRATLLMERERERQVRDKEMQQLQTNQMLAKSFQQRKTFIDKVVYSNPPTDAYFAQFNTTSR
ncbi:hypothetical protein AMAG_03074 [Allomyces macrogynus ATCC 38327]|uniref:RIB43A-like with coiled-coils protein 2 n=1 Tax=Allomyces macrogynus (strain ATCC 38327) TaxID=578462 RepID=A0A0L0S4P4_ALLM3|nr:hypothetical protein AMAG_03074 [Allomyces macrogynus ATCC 38327]|eukprot:KNE57354.1 hypothetical protein AMAG_03074 [Allomyces macrogynus ATCC 38327]